MLKNPSRRSHNGCPYISTICVCSNYPAWSRTGSSSKRIASKLHSRRGRKSISHRSSYSSPFPQSRIGPRHKKTTTVQSPSRPHRKVPNSSPRSPSTKNLHPFLLQSPCPAPTPSNKLSSPHATVSGSQTRTGNLGCAPSKSLSFRQAASSKVL